MKPTAYAEQLQGGGPLPTALYETFLQGHLHAFIPKQIGLRCVNRLIAPSHCSSNTMGLRVSVPTCSRIFKSEL